MKKFMKIILSAMKSWTKKEIKKEIDNAPVAAPNWNESNPNSIDYIKNRTHWEEIKEIVLVDNLTFNEYDNGNAPQCNFVPNQTYTVIWNDKKYENLVCYFDGSYNIIADSDLGCPFYIDDDGGNGLYINSNNDSTDWTVSISTVGTVIHKLDAKYLPDDIGVQVDWDEEDETSKSYIKNKPFGKGKNFLINDTIEINQDGYYEFDRAINIDPNSDYFCTINGANYLTNTYYDDTDYYYVISLMDEDGNGVGYVYDDNSIYLITSIFDPSQSYDIAIYTKGIQKIDTKFLPDETDPTVPDWAKQDNKPSYTVDEIDGAARQSDLNELMKYHVFTDHATGFEYLVYIENGNLVSQCKPIGIEVTNMPTKMVYMHGSAFDPSGMVVSIVSQDGNKRIIDKYVYTKYADIDNPICEITYTELGISYTTFFNLSVIDIDPAVDLIDFTYENTSDGKYQILDWKQTLNGVKSTELIIPNSKVILV